MRFVVVFLLWCSLVIVAMAQRMPDLREYRERAANQEGDTGRGKELFFDENKCCCARCHSIDGSASMIGPIATVVHIPPGNRSTVCSASRGPDSRMSQCPCATAVGVTDSMG